MKPLLFVIPVFRRPAGLDRLVKALFARSQPTLLVSVEGGAPAATKEAVYRLRTEFPFEVVEHKEPLGLRRHLLWCGDRTNEAEAVVVLEDDLYVSEHYMTYCTVLAAEMDNCPGLAGASLYSHRRNPFTTEYFEPTFDGKQFYLLQMPSSWGQLWTRSQWTQFREWYGANLEIPIGEPSLPGAVRGWSSQSWLKHFAHYMVATGKTFLYPRVSVTSNGHETGAHSDEETAIFQVPILQGEQDWRFPSKVESLISYDMFFERSASQMAPMLGVQAEELVVDLYGLKELSGGEKWWITRKSSVDKPLQSYGCKARPHECNIALGIPGTRFNLTRTPMRERKDLSKIVNDFSYYNPSITPKRAGALSMFEAIRLVRRRLGYM